MKAWHTREEWDTDRKRGKGLCKTSYPAQGDCGERLERTIRTLIWRKEERIKYASKGIYLVLKTDEVSRSLIESERDIWHLEGMNEKRRQGQNERCERMKGEPVDCFSLRLIPLSVAKHRRVTCRHVTYPMTSTSVLSLERVCQQWTPTGRTRSRELVPRKTMTKAQKRRRGLVPRKTMPTGQK